jgi:hypothetical protein
MSFELVSDPSIFIEISINREKSSYYFPKRIKERNKKLFRSAKILATKFSYQEILNFFSSDYTNCDKRMKKIIKHKL